MQVENRRCKTMISDDASITPRCRLRIESKTKILNIDETKQIFALKKSIPVADDSLLYVSTSTQ